MDIFNPLEYIPSFFKVLTKGDENAVSSLIPMQLFPAQLYYAQNRSHRDVVLKPRQVGLSTGVLALNFHHLITNPYTRIGVIAHKEDTAKFLLQTVHRFYNNLPPGLKPEIDWKSSTEMRFPKLDSYIHIDSAASKSIGRGETLNIAHLSEVAQWYEPNAVELFAGVTQTVPVGGYITIESTPKGRGGFFYRIYEAAKRGEIPGYKTFFFPWWYEPSYRIDAPIGATTREEQILIDTYNLTTQQIAWRRLKIAELNDLFFQEYPENDVDCWLSSEVNAFDGFTLRKYLLQAKPGVKEGNLETWKNPMGGRRYIIGVDVAGGLPKGDFSVATVLDSKSNEHVATLRGRIPPDMFTQQILQLGKKYNNALVAVERANHGHTVLQILLDNNYPNIYYHKDYDTSPLKLPSQPGWLTSGKTRASMIDMMATALRSGDLTTYDKVLLEEAASFQIVGQRYEAPPGEHDDSLFAIMIALSVREQQPLSNAPRPRVESYISL